MKQALKVTLLYWRVALLNELQYRINFFLQLFQSLLSLFTGLVGLALIFRQTNQLAGWSQNELLVVLGIYTLLGGLMRASIYPSMMKLLQDIIEGNLDFALTKPVDSQLIVSVRAVEIWQLIDVVLGSGVIIYAMLGLHQSLGVWQVLSFIFALGLGSILLYCFCLCITTIAFWATRADNIIELFQGVYQAGRVPVSIYPGWLRVLLTFLVPVAFAISVPAEALTNRLTWQTLLMAIGFSLLMALFTRWFWRFGIKSYSGASA